MEFVFSFSFVLGEEGLELTAVSIARLAGKCKFFAEGMYKKARVGESSDKHTEEAFMKPKSIKHTTVCILCLWL